MPYYRVCLPLVSSPDAEDAKRLALSVIRTMNPDELIGFLEAEEMTDAEVEEMRTRRRD